MEQGIDLAGEVFCVFVGNKLVSFHPEPPVFVIAVIAETAAGRAVCFGVTASADPMGPPRSLLVVTREEIGRKDNSLYEMVLLLGFAVFHVAWIDCVDSSNHHRLCGIYFAVFIFYGKLAMKVWDEQKSLFPWD